MLYAETIGLVQLWP